MRILPALLLVSVAALSGCGDTGRPVADPATPTPATAGTEPSPEPGEETPPPTAAAEAPGGACGEVEQLPVQGGEHLIGDQEPPVPYSSTPPTSGWHASGAFEVGAYDADEPLSEPRQVSVLEAGGVVITYHGIDEEARAQLVDLATDEFEGRVAVTPYDELAPGEVALAAWGTLQRCDGVDVDAIRSFVEAHADEGPIEPGHDH